MDESDIRWSTPHMNRDFEMLVFGDRRGLPLIHFPTSFGNHRQNKDFGRTGASMPASPSSTREKSPYYLSTS